MSLFRSEWLLPISQPPIRDAWLRTQDGRIVAFGHSRPGDFTASDEIDLGAVAVLPGLINAHTHLELSWMRGRIPEARQFSDWLERVLRLRSEQSATDARDERAVVEAIREARAFGTAALGDVSNTLASASPLAREQMPAVVFYELLGFEAVEAERLFAGAIQEARQWATDGDVKVSLAPHAPYSVSAPLFRLIADWVQQHPLFRSSVHLGESDAEVEFLRDGTGACRTMLDALGKWDPSWEVPGCNPVEYLRRLGFLHNRTLVVHGVLFTSAELQQLRASGATLVTCPRGNIRTGAGTPPIGDFYEAGVSVAVGTDSLASVPDLNVFAELAQMRNLAPSVSARMLVESATMCGARGLGLEAEFGSIDPGKRDSLIAVELDGAVSSIEEYLVSGIEASQVRWLPS